MYLAAPACMHAWMLADLVLYVSKHLWVICTLSQLELRSCDVVAGDDCQSPSPLPRYARGREGESGLLQLAISRHILILHCDFVCFAALATYRHCLLL